jgi:hypothetical protein
MRPAQRILRTLGLVAFASVVLGVVALVTLLESGVLTPKILAFVNRHLNSSGNLHLSTSSVHWRPWSGIVLTDVLMTIPTDFSESPPDSLASSSEPSASRSPILSVGRIEVGYRFGGLFLRRPVVRQVRVTRPDLDLEELSRWNARLAEIRASTPAGSGEESEKRKFGLESLAIRELRITDGRVQGGRGVGLTRLRLTGQLEGEKNVWRLVIANAGTRVKTETIDEEVELTGEIGLVDGAIVLDGLHLVAAGGRVSFEGRLDPWGETKSNLLTTGYAIPLERIGTWIGREHPLLTGKLELRVRTSGTREALAVKGSVRSLDDNDVGREAKFDVRRLGDDVSVESLSLASRESRFNVSGTLHLGDSLRVDGMAAFSNLDPAPLLAEEDLAALEDLGGTVRFEGTGLSRAKFVGSAELELSGGSVLGYRFDSASIQARMRNGELTLTEARVRRGASHVAGAGSISADNEVIAELQGTILDLADLSASKPPAATLEKSVEPPLTGQASMDLRLRGPLAGPSLAATLTFEEAGFFGARAHRLTIDLASERLGKGGKLDVSAEGEGIGYGRSVLSRGKASGALESGSVTVTKLLLESSRRGELQLAGDLKLTGLGRLSGQVAELSIESSDKSVRWVSQQPISVERTAESVSFAGVHLTSGTGEIRGDFSFDKRGAASIHAKGTGVDLSVFSPFFLVPKELGGLLEFQTNAIIGADALSADVELDLADGRYGEDSLEHALGRIEVRDERIVFDKFEFRSSLATAALDGNLSLKEGSFRSVFADSAARARVLDQIEFENLDVQFVCPDLARVRETFPSRWWPIGKASLAAQMDGPAMSPIVEFRTEIAPGSLGGEPFESCIVNGRYDGSALHIDQGRLLAAGGALEFSGDLPLAMSSSSPKPRFVPGASANLVFRAKGFPARGLAYVVPSFEMASGRVDASGRLVGVTDSFHLEGEFLVEQGEIVIPTFDDPLSSGIVTGAFDREGISIATARFLDGKGGQVSGSGRVALRNLGLSDLDIDLVGTNYHYSGFAGIRGFGDGRLHIGVKPLRGGRKVPYFSGRMTVERVDMDGRIVLPPEEQTGGPVMPAGVTLPEPEGPRAPFLPTVPAPPVAVFLADIDFSASNNAWLHSEGTEVEMAGVVTLHVTEDYFGISGNVRTLRGVYSVLNTRFDIERGEIEFTDPSDVQASVIDGIGTANVLDEEVKVMVSGTLGAPVIEITTESGMTEAEIYELLALRIKRNPQNGEADSQETRRALLESWGQVLVNRFGSEISRELGFDTLDLEMQEESTKVGVGKRLGRDVFVKYTREVTGTEKSGQTGVISSVEGPDQQLLLEYRLSKIFQIQGETGKLDGDDYLNVDLWAEWGY